MTDQTPEPPTADAGIFANSDHAATKAQIDTILDLDTILSSARRVERTAYINARADLEDEYDQAVEELAVIVDEDGELVDRGDDSLGDESRAAQLSQRITDLRTEMKKSTSTVRFRALDSDAWEEFESAHRGKNREIKDARVYENDLIAACAIAPALTVSDVVKLRKVLSHNQILSMFNEAYRANIQGGLDVPKSPSFLHAPKPQEPSLS